jgi:hypothetical protein
MNEFVRAALIGLARDAGPAPFTGTPADPLVPEGDRERTFLLRAAARDLYLRAGLVPRKFEGEADAAPPESLRSCSPRLTAALVDAADGDADVYRAIGDALAAAKLHAPHRLLPELLGVRDHATRAALAPVLGARGRWLARKNAAWAWAAGSAAAEADVSARWDEGNTEERVEAFREMRDGDAAAALAKLEAVWPKEKAEVRAALLAGVATSISPADEAFLERARTDRSIHVKGVAEDLLARLPQSAFVAERTRSASSALQKAATPASMWAKVRAGFGAKVLKLVVEPPPAEGSGGRARLLVQLVSAVPLSHWTATFEAEPEAILEAARATDWTEPLLEGWALAAARQRDASWAQALLLRVPKQLTSESKLALAAALPAGELMRILRGAAPDEWPLAGMLALLPMPWPHDFARDWLRRLQQVTASGRQSQNYVLFDTIELTARALPVSLHDEAVRDWTFADAGWRVQWERRVEKFIRIIRLRKQIAEEIAS